ncbi:MAG TPA: hypothetical protein VG994_10225 [Steroidobacteraceae bacterium]|nr:hypothetical protein [Steroidobacteraceae bacterium]
MKHQNKRSPLAAGILIACCAAATAASSDYSDSSQRWWAPGQGTPLPAYATYDDDSGAVGVLNLAGEIATRGHPFFEPIGANGRACVTCHQPADGMGLSVRSIRERWQASGGKDPLFAPVDGMNCPNLPPEDPRSHSLLLERGLFRIALPWPPKRPDGTPIDPEFTIEVVRDPTGCNTDPQYGLNSPHPTISVYRRPRPVANTKYTTHQNFGVGPFIGKNGMPTATDPATGKPTSMNLMADARFPTLAVQAEDAAEKHLQIAGKLSPAQLAAITDFEKQVYVAQVTSASAGSLVEPGGPPALGPRNLAAGEAGVLGNNTTRYVFPLGEQWKHLPRGADDAENARNAARESIARGHDVFMFRTFWIKDSMHLNTVGLGNPAKRTCATCHGMHMTGMDTANGWMDIGTTNLPWAKEVPLNPWNEERPELPLFRITCKPGVKPHPFLGRVIYTQDPGRALISGQCNDVGTIVIQQFRGLAARAPYFSNGSAATLRELVDYYDRRYNIGYSEQEKQDLVNFLGAL